MAPTCVQSMLTTLHHSEDSFQYIVMKQVWRLHLVIMLGIPAHVSLGTRIQSGSFPQMLNQTRLWDGANVDTGGIWDPHIFDRGKFSKHSPLPTVPPLTVHHSAPSMYRQRLKQPQHNRALTKGRNNGWSSLPSNAARLLPSLRDMVLRTHSLTILFPTGRLE